MKEIDSYNNFGELLEDSGIPMSNREILKKKVDFKDFGNSCQV
jgi:hypothetical protein